jgi:quercetin dioxygenase-like cupin family protein
MVEGERCHEVVRYEGTRLSHRPIVPHLFATRAVGRYRTRMNDATRTFFADLASEAVLPDRGIHSQTLSRGDGVELVLFAMAAGEGLADHSAARPAIIHVLSGEGDLTVAGDAHSVGAGSWLRMEARTPHAIQARTGLVFALYLLPV